VRRIFSVFYWLLFALAQPVLFLGALVVFLVTFPFDRNRVVLHLYSCAWAQASFWINPMWRMKVLGREKLPWRGPAVLVSNHASLVDIPVLYGLFRPYKWVSKESVFRVPFVGWNMYLNGYVGLKRGSAASVVRMLAACERWLDRGVPVLIFPEGTRSPDGEVKAFKDGAFVLAARKDVPIYPIVLTGTARTLPKNGLIFREVARCELRVLDPVKPADFDRDPAKLRDHVRGLIVAERRRETNGPGPTGGR
jgi:1-acyl-sn-glycerol-3-phosphate acyltransferase